MTTPENKLAYLLFGDDGRSAYTHCVAWDFPFNPEDPLQKQKRGMPTLVYASMAAMETNLKQLTNRRIGKLSRLALWPDAIQINLPTQCRYATWTAPLKGDFHHVIMAHPAALASTVHRHPVFYLVRPLDDQGIPDAAPPAFFEFLNRTTSIPMKPNWTSFLWDTLKQNQAIELCPGYRSNILRCAPQPQVLLTHIQTALQDGRIH